MSRPQRLPTGSGSSTPHTEQWDVESIFIDNEIIRVIDIMVRNGELTSERRERTLTTAQVDSLFANQQARKFDTWLSNIHGFATPI